MICVSIGRTGHSKVIAEHQELAGKGARLVELRLDYLSKPPELQRLIEQRPTPVIITCRRESDRGKWRGDEEQRRTLLRSAIVAGVEYVDLEEDAAKAIRRYGKTQRIVSYHNFDETPADLEEIHARLCRLDPDVVKIVTTANSHADNVRMLKLVQSSKIPTAGFCMGEIGVITRILTGRFGSPFSYAVYHQERTLAPGQLTFEQMTKTFRYDSISRSTKVFAVVGDPIAHSMSPVIHNAAYQHLGIDAVYVPLRIPKGGLATAVAEYDWLPISGYSVTIPHKEALLAVAEECDAPVREIGAANTLYRRNGKWVAANSDCEAALSSLQRAMNQLSSGPSRGGEMGSQTTASLAGRHVLLVGAGGVARAIGWGVKQRGCELTIANRSRERGELLAKALGARAVNWDIRTSVEPDIVVNCTSVGMHPNVDESPVPGNCFHEGMIAFDTVYNPEQTLFLKQAGERCCQTISGVEMFVGQAARQFELFTGQAAPLDVMRKALKRHISPVKDED